MASGADPVNAFRTLCKHVVCGFAALSCSEKLRVAIFGYGLPRLVACSGFVASFSKGCLSLDASEAGHLTVLFELFTGVAMADSWLFLMPPTFPLMPWDEPDMPDFRSRHLTVLPVHWTFGLELILSEAALVVSPRLSSFSWNVTFLDEPAAKTEPQGAPEPTSREDR